MKNGIYQESLGKYVVFQDKVYSFHMIFVLGVSKQALMRDFKKFLMPLEFIL